MRGPAAGDDRYQLALGHRVIALATVAAAGSGWRHLDDVARSRVPLEEIRKTWLRCQTEALREDRAAEVAFNEEDPLSGQCAGRGQTRRHSRLSLLGDRTGDRNRPQGAIGGQEF